MGIWGPNERDQQASPLLFTDAAGRQSARS